MTLRLRRFRSTLAAFILAWSMIASNAAFARTILFVGNSFTFGANSPVRHYHADRVTDLNGGMIGGVPALFKTFAEQAGLDWTVSLETIGGADLALHLATKRAVLDRPWDVVVLQGYSTLDAERPGEATRHIAAARALAAMFHRRNPNAQIYLMATWSRADQTYLPGGHWYGQPIGRMADDLATASRGALGPGSGLTAVIPAGAAWNRAIANGLADPNPYDGITFGQIDLWSWDQYHPSTDGYYLTALVAFGAVTGRDPQTLGEQEQAADDLGIDPRVATKLRGVAAGELSASHRTL